MEEKRKRDTARGRFTAAFVLIAVGLVFLMVNIGLVSMDRVGETVGQAAGSFGDAMGSFGQAIGEFFGRFGEAMGEFFGNFGEAMGSFFGNLASNFSRLWPLLLIVIGLALLFRRPRSKRKIGAAAE